MVRNKVLRYSEAAKRACSFSSGDEGLAVAAKLLEVVDMDETEALPTETDRVCRVFAIGTGGGGDGRAMDGAMDGARGRTEDGRE